MKMVKKWMILAGAVGFLLSCEYNVSMETVVHPDGSLDRTIILDKVDSSEVDNNYFGISSASEGWETSMEKERMQSDSTSIDKGEKLVITFQKHFSSWQESNQELNASVDSLFKVESKFEKKFRWFYTYLYYSDTYKAIDRFHHTSQEDYFTQEDYAFIDRLPAEGKEISKADKLYLELLDEKIFDHYASRGIFEDQFSILTSLIEKYELDRRWLDTLYHHKEAIYSFVLENDDGLNIALGIADSLSIPLPHPQVDKDYAENIGDFHSRLNFMQHTSGIDSFTHNIRMPWTVVSTNADSISGSHLMWQPPVMKFLLKDYMMYAEARKMNYWAVTVSVIIVLLTIFLIVRNRN